MSRLNNLKLNIQNYINNQQKGLNELKELIGNMDINNKSNDFRIEQLLQHDFNYFVNVINENDITYKDKNGNNILHKLLLNVDGCSNKYEKIKYILDYSCNYNLLLENSVNKNELYPFDIACFNENIKVMKLLIDYSANIVDGKYNIFKLKRHNMNLFMEIIDYIYLNDKLELLKLDFRNHIILLNELQLFVYIRKVINSC